MYSLDWIFSVYCRRRLAGILVLLPLLATIHACRKEPRDTTPPIIVITEPSGNSIYYYQNLISIRAMVSDETRLESIVVEITTAANVRVLQSRTIAPTGKEQTIDVDITHDDLYLNSGSYVVRVTAFDGIQYGYAFTEIQLVEAPRFLERMFVVRASSSTAAIDSINNGTLIPWLTYEGNYAFGGIDSYSNQLVACSLDPTEISNLNYPELETISAPLPGTTSELTAFHHDRIGHQFIWGTAYGELFVTDAEGSRLFSSIYASDRIRHITANRNYIIACSATSSGATNYIDVYRRTSGQPMLTLTLDWQITGAIPLVSDEQFIVLAGNTNGQSHFAYLNLDTGVINENFNFYNLSPVSSISAADGDDFYAIQADGIVRYHDNFSSYSTYASLHPNRLIYDDLNHALWAIDQSGLHQFNESITQETNFIPVANALDLWFKYNK